MRILDRAYIIASVAILLTFISCSSSREFHSPTYYYSKKTSSKTKSGIVVNNDLPTRKFIDSVTVSGTDKKMTLTVTPEIKKSIEVKDLLLEKYASIIDIATDSITNYSLYRFIDDWYGVHYKYGGNDKSGIDCSAFSQRLFQQVFCTNILRTCFEQYHMSQQLSTKDDLHEGDLVFFKTRGRRISHVGIYLANDYFVHASSSGVMISNLKESYWAKRYAGAGSITEGYSAAF